MKAETTRVMQEALDAAVRRMNGNGNGNGSGGSGGNAGAESAASATARPMDPLGAIMSILPKLLQNNKDDKEEGGDELLEKLDSLQKGDIAALREQVQILRKQCHRLIRSQEQIFGAQEQILEALGDLQRQQGAVNGVVLDLARQMSRIGIIEEEDETEPPPNERANERTVAAGSSPQRPASSARSEQPEQPERSQATAPPRPGRPQHTTQQGAPAGPPAGVQRRMQPKPPKNVGRDDLDSRSGRSK